MCGRFALVSNKTLLENQFSMITSYIDMDYTSYNITPFYSVPVIHLNKHNDVTLSMMSWGLIPIWTQNFQESVNRPINARIETLEQKVSFREAYNKRRCLILASGFYEWDENSNPKQPHYFYLSDNKFMTFAGIWNYRIIENSQINLASEILLSHLVSTNVGNPKNNDASLISKIH